MQERDYRRDESFIAFRTLIEASSHRKVDAVIEAANKLSRIIRSHGWSLQSESRAIQSAKMSSLIKELNLSDNGILIETLKATDWYQDMIDDNAAYRKLHEDRIIAEASEEDYNTMAVYKDLRIACQELFDGIEVLNRLFPNEKYINMANFINDSSQRHMITARTRKTRTENLKDETEEQEV